MEISDDLKKLKEKLIKARNARCLVFPANIKLLLELFELIERK